MYYYHVQRENTAAVIVHKFLSFLFVWPILVSQMWIFLHLFLGFPTLALVALVGTFQALGISILVAIPGVLHYYTAGLLEKSNYGRDNGTGWLLWSAILQPIAIFLIACIR